MAEKQDGYVRTAIRMPPELHKEVNRLAHQQDRTFNGQLLAMLKEATQTKVQQQGPAQ